MRTSKIGVRRATPAGERLRVRWSVTIRPVASSRPLQARGRDRGPDQPGPRTVETLSVHQPGAWNDFVDRFLGLVYHVVHHTAHLRSTPLRPEDAEDLAAEILLQIVAGDYAVLRQFRGKSSLATYLTVVARRICVQRTGPRTAAREVQAAAGRAEPPPSRPGPRAGRGPREAGGGREAARQAARAGSARWCASTTSKAVLRGDQHRAEHAGQQHRPHPVARPQKAPRAPRRGRNGRLTGGAGAGRSVASRSAEVAAAGQVVGFVAQAGTREEGGRALLTDLVGLDVP